MFRTLPAKAVLGLVLIAAAAPAAAGASGAPPHVAVPAGQLQHSVTQLSWPAATNTFQHDTLQQERWTTATASRFVETDVRTGKVQQDCSYTAAVARCFEAADYAADGTNIAPHGVTWIFPGNPALVQSFADAGADVKDLIGDPHGYLQTATTTFLGHPALVLTQATQPNPDRGTSSATVYAEADNDYPLFREDISADPGTSTNRPGGDPIIVHTDELTTTTTLETISPTGIQLTIGAHPGATVKDARPSAVHAAKKKAPAHKKAVAHKKASHKKATHKRKGYGSYRR